MNKGYNAEICAQLGMTGKGQMRTPYRFKNLYWSLDDGKTSFGYGDLNDVDLKVIQTWLYHPSHLGDFNFTGWNEHHDTQWEQTKYPIVEISVKKGITFPHREAQERVKAGLASIREARNA